MVTIEKVRYCYKGDELILGDIYVLFKNRIYKLWQIELTNDNCLRLVYYYEIKPSWFATFTARISIASREVVKFYTSIE